MSARSSEILVGEVVAEHRLGEPDTSRQSSGVEPLGLLARVIVEASDAREDERGVVPAEPERVAHGDGQVGLAGDVGHVVQVALRGPDR